MGNCCAAAGPSNEERDAPSRRPPSQRTAVGEAGDVSAALSTAASEWHRRRSERRQRRSEAEQQEEVRQGPELETEESPSRGNDDTATMRPNRLEDADADDDFDDPHPAAYPNDQVAPVVVAMDTEPGSLQIENRNSDVVRQFQEAMVAGLRLHQLRLHSGNRSGRHTRRARVFSDPAVPVVNAAPARGFGEQDVGMFDGDDVDGFLDMLLALHALQEQQQQQHGHGSDSGAALAHQPHRIRRTLLVPDEAFGASGADARPTQSLASMMFAMQRQSSYSFLGGEREAHTRRNAPLQEPPLPHSVSVNLDDVTISVIHKSASASAAPPPPAVAVVVGSSLAGPSHDEGKAMGIDEPVAVGHEESDARREELYCVICLSSYESGEPIRILPCFHRFHRDCVDKWLLGRVCQCPICRHDPRVLALQHASVTLEEEVVVEEAHAAFDERIRERRSQESVQDEGAMVVAEAGTSHVDRRILAPNNAGVEDWSETTTDGTSDSTNA